MAQATMTVRTDAKVKTEFTNLCEQFGMSANTAMNIFMRAVMETRTIPFTIGVRNNANDRLRAMLFDNIERRRASNQEEISIDEINAEIAACRQDRKK